VSEPDLEVVVPLRWYGSEDLEEMTDYLRRIRSVAQVTVVDGSEPAVFERHAQRWAGLVRHLPPGPWPGRNRKVAGVVTGVLAARSERVVVADDDVRHEPAQLVELARRLEDADLVRPQNVFDPMPWHASWDTARSLLNRALGADHPGTFALRRSTFRRMGGYDGDALFENLQMVRTFRAAGARVRNAPDVYVRRRPPTARQFGNQRIRQAYDDFGQPGRLVLEASWLPGLVLLSTRGPARLLAPVAASVVLAEVGRRRAGGARVYPATAALWAPVWCGERAVCVWLAIAARLRGGAWYHGERVRSATVPVRVPPAGRTDQGTAAAAS
jgi:hypothetical protein